MNKKYKGILYILLAAFSFSLMNLFIQLSGDIPSMQKSFFRNFVAMLFALAVVLKQKISFRTEPQHLKFLILRSTFGVIGIVGNFYAVDHLVLSDASMLNKMSPFFGVIFSYFFLKEKCKPSQILAILVAFIGSLFIVKPTFANADLFASVCGFLGGVCAGAAYTCVRHLSSKGVKGPYIVFFFSGFSSLVLLPNLIFNYAPMTSHQFCMLLLVGLAAAGGQFSITAAYAHAPAKEISVYDYSQVVFSAILGFFIFGQIPDAYSFFGYLLIIGMAVFMFLQNKGK